MVKNLVLIAAIFVLALYSCEKEANDNNDSQHPPNDTTTLISFYNGKLSHQQGNNCQSCHQKEGSGKGWFNISGSVYDSTLMQVFPNATVRLFDGINGTGNIIYTLEVDSLGNFYTTDSIDFGTGLYVKVEGVQANVQMGSAITSGACNKCHGVTTNRIWTK